MIGLRRKSGQWLAQNAAGESAAKGAAKVHGRVLGEAVEFFRAAYPEEWETLRLCPLQHGLEAMGEMLTSSDR